MNEEWQWWALILGILLGVGGYWLLRERLPRREEDIDPVERSAEADWISRSVERMGGQAPPEVVSIILDLHREYLAERAPIEPSGADHWESFDPGPEPTADGTTPSPRSASPSRSREIPADPDLLTSD
jgi:hypothetical protein